MRGVKGGEGYGKGTTTTTPQKKEGHGGSQGNAIHRTGHTHMVRIADLKAEIDRDPIVEHNRLGVAAQLRLGLKYGDLKRGG